MCASVSLIASWRWWARIALATSVSASSVTLLGRSVMAWRIFSSRRSLLRRIASIRSTASPNGRPWPGSTNSGRRSVITRSDSR